MSNYYVNIAGITIKIVNLNKISKLIIDDLNATKSKEKIKYDISFEILDETIKNYKPLIFSAKGNMNFNKSQYFVDYLGDINYCVKNLFCDSHVKISINTNKNSLKKLIKNIYTNKNNRVKNTILSYSLFWYLLHIQLLKKKKAFLHAGIFANNGSATIITGTGGCGKTSTLFKILESHTTSYIAEDFGIIDNDGYTYYNPKPVSIYASDMEFGQNILKNYFYKFSKNKQFLWSVKRKLLKLNPMVKAKPNLLMPERICQKSKIKNIIYFVRNSDEELSIENINLNELVERTLDASMRELKTLNELLLLIKANAPINYNIPSFEDIRANTKQIYLNAFKDTKNKVINIPHKTKADELVNFLKTQKLI